MAVIDVFVPCYQYGRFLPECISSVLNQSLADFRILIIDDASPDGSAEVARELAAKDPRIEVKVHQINRGHIATYNEGIDWAASDYFLLLSADDVLAPGALEHAVNLLESRPEASFLYGAYVKARDAGTFADSSKESAEGWTIKAGDAFIAETCRAGLTDVSVCTAIVRTSAQKRAGGYRTELPHSGDQEMWLRLAMEGPVIKTGRIQGCYRVHDENMSTGIYRTVTLDYYQRAAAFDWFFNGTGAQMAQASHYRVMARRTLAEEAFWAAVAATVRGNPQAALELLRFGWRSDPRSILLPSIGRLLQTRNLNQRIFSVLGDLMRRLGKADLGRSPGVER